MWLESSPYDDSLPESVEVWTVHSHVLYGSDAAYCPTVRDPNEKHGWLRSCADKLQTKAIELSMDLL